MSDGPIHVMAGILRDRTGRVLLAQRPQGKHLEGLWEFPGGKRDPSETPLAALARELLEELGIEIHEAESLVAVAHAYPDKRIRLDAWCVTRWTGEPQGLDGQSLAWVPLPELEAWPMPPADRPIVTALRLPSRYAITPEPGEDGDDFLRRFEQLVAGGIRLVQLRSKVLDQDALHPLARCCVALAERHAADLLINGQPRLALELGVGLHLPSSMLRDWSGNTVGNDGRDAWLPRNASDLPTLRNASDLNRSTKRDARGWLAASCHDAAELALAARIGCDFVTLSPVHATRTHPDAQLLGWPAFADLAEKSPLPAFALGGVGLDDESTARELGARGIAGIGAFWPVS
jgi:8-oxo-dGTP diphosphatase